MEQPQKLRSAFYQVLEKYMPHILVEEANHMTDYFLELYLPPDMSGTDKYYDSLYLQDLIQRVWQSYGLALDAPLSDLQIMRKVMALEGIISKEQAWKVVTNMWHKDMLSFDTVFYYPKISSF